MTNWWTDYSLTTTNSWKLIGDIHDYYHRCYYNYILLSTK